MLLGLGLIPLAQGVVAGLLGRAPGAFVLGHLSPGVAGVLLGGLDPAAGILPDSALLPLGGLLLVPGCPDAALGQLGADAGLALVAAGSGCLGAH
ncbi:hypothetical protein [Nonomuraea sp. NPDC005692]|uniref:hypothetical protein n=1 Tax=Nonomuraea sp. NPDC005692 TaxID=3157168 RepID=UPI0033D3B9D0